MADVSHPNIEPPPPLRRNSSDEEQRIDSAVEVSPTDPPPPPASPSALRVSRFVIPPSIAGHNGRLLQARQVIPNWAGVVIVLGVFAWAVWCSVYVFPLLGGRRHEKGG
ncbi:hypothetical protein BU26DRAFT_600088 [Trematosphaeria pertusa]|uniref:Transmembrane protein n=1 Tax=Trematosphaeria pertusa TaxID=390896 RepID=A0A6A6IVR9_9PLEO|nr:uncharacterized protein BU26DRAFT_600088 [Trematosphaeria pertusa]KAF2254358.1 hypothetical protein BU26DRAFT_600088 [Trematosphaeria pertusa]